MDKPYKEANFKIGETVKDTNYGMGTVVNVLSTDHNKYPVIVSFNQYKHHTKEYTYDGRLNEDAMVTLEIYFNTLDRFLIEVGILVVRLIRILFSIIVLPFSLLIYSIRKANSWYNMMRSLIK